MDLYTIPPKLFFLFPCVPYQSGYFSPRVGNSVTLNDWHSGDQNCVQDDFASSPVLRASSVLRGVAAGSSAQVPRRASLLLLPK